MSQAFYASSSDLDIDSELDKYLAEKKIGNVKGSIMTTPPRNTVTITLKDSLTPRSKEFLKNQEQEKKNFQEMEEKYKGAKSELAEKIEEYKKNFSDMEQSFEKQKETLKQDFLKQEENLKERASKLELMLSTLANRYNILADSAGKLEVSSILKSKIASTITKTTQDLDSEILKTDTLFPLKKAELYQLATSLVAAINNRSDRESVDISSLYDQLLTEVELVKDLKNFELDESQRSRIVNFFKEKYDLLIKNIVENQSKPEELAKENDSSDSESFDDILATNPLK